MNLRDLQGRVVSDPELIFFRFIFAIYFIGEDLLESPFIDQNSTNGSFNSKRMICFDWQDYSLYPNYQKSYWKRGKIERYHFCGQTTDEKMQIAHKFNLK